MGNKAAETNGPDASLVTLKTRSRATITADKTGFPSCFFRGGHPPLSVQSACSVTFASKNPDHSEPPLRRIFYRDGTSASSVESF
jgi:hypothetical protein